MAAILIDPITQEWRKYWKHPWWKRLFRVVKPPHVEGVPTFRHWAKAVKETI